jgi:hypothetical protein
MHLYGPERGYLLHHDGVFVSKAWGGTGNLVVEGGIFMPGTPVVFQQYVGGAFTGLDVRAYFEGFNGGHFVIYDQFAQGVWLDVNAGWNLNSDEALKKDVAAMEPVLERVLKLRPVRYRWKRNDVDGSGFIAQEVEALFPDLVKEGSPHPEVGRRMKSIAYDRFGMLAIAALQEMKKEFDERLAELEQELRPAAAPTTRRTKHERRDP